jgi:putative transposase
MTQKNTLRDKLSNGEVLNLSANIIEDVLGLDSAPNTIYSDKTIIYHLINACASQTSVHQVCTSCCDAPIEGTIRHRLRNLELDEVQKALNQGLKYNVSKTLSRKNQSFAIDFVNIPFYGEEKTRGDTIRTKPRQGTSRFYSYATIYLIKKNKRYTLAIKYVRSGETLKDTIDFLLNEVEKAGFKIKELLLDREFFTVDVIKYLQDRKTSFIIPCVKRGRSGGIRNLFVGRKSYSTKYTMRSANGEVTFQVNVVVKYSKGKYNRNELEYFAYAVYNMDIPVIKTFKEYRKRFGIESSYKQMNKARARTSTKNPVLRLLYVGLGFLLENIWIYLHWTYLSIPRQGGRQPLTWSFKTMLRQINRKIEEILGFQDYVLLPHLTTPS